LPELLAIEKGDQIILKNAIVAATMTSVTQDKNNFGGKHGYQHNILNFHLRVSYLGIHQPKHLFDSNSLHTLFNEGTTPAISVNYARVNEKYGTISSTFGVAIAKVSPDSFRGFLLGFNTNQC
jgi:hypothetical protein